MQQEYPTGTIFRHYKGNLYQFLYIARHSETLEELVVYKALYGDRGIWVRPATMFFGTVLHNEAAVPRFAIDNQAQATEPE